MLPLLLVRTKLGGVNGCKFIIYKFLTFRLCVLHFNPIQFFKIWFRMRQQNTSGNGKEPSLEKGKWQSPPSPRLVINVDHRIVGILAFVLVNPLSATPLFSQHGLRALFGLVVFMPRGRKVAPVQNLPQGACYQAMHQSSPLSMRWWIRLSPCQPGLVSNGKSHCGHGSFRRGS
jgi:hypothetical protein